MCRLITLSVNTRIPGPEVVKEAPLMAAEGPLLKGDAEGASLYSYRGSKKEFGGNVRSEILHFGGSGCRRKAQTSPDTFKCSQMVFDGENRSCSPSEGYPKTFLRAGSLLKMTSGDRPLPDPSLKNHTVAKLSGHLTPHNSNCHPWTSSIALPGSL